MRDDFKIKITLFVPAGEAAATPPVGPILGQYGINTVQFCNDFNELTNGAKQFFDDEELKDDDFGGFMLIVDVFINYDRTYDYIIRKPTVSFLLRVLADVSIGKPHGLAGYLTVAELVLLAQFKFPYKLVYQKNKKLKPHQNTINFQYDLKKFH